MATVERTMGIDRTTVWEALLEPETYPHWLVGAQDIRAVDAAWPAPGAAFHHRVGLAGPLTVADRSKVIEIDEPRRLVLDVRARPFGRAKATFELAQDGDGRCTVRLHEKPVGPAAVLGPLTDPLLARRNRRSLEQLDEYVTQSRAHR